MNGATLHPVGPSMTGHIQRSGTPSVFINYRTEDEPWATMYLRNELAGRFGQHAVFVDLVSVVPGADYRQSLLRAVVRSSAVLVVIGRRWATAARDGRLLLDNEQDWVRREIALAIVTGVPLVPVLVGDARPPTAAELPEELVSLAHRQYVRLRHEDCVRDLETLANSIATLAPDLNRTVHASTPERETTAPVARRP
jgi:hypothetical protein